MKAQVLQMPWEAVGDHFQRGGDSRELLYLTLVVLALIVLLVIVHRMQGWAAARTPANDPQKLFRNVLAKLNLGVRERDLIRHIARDRGIQHPITLVLCPSVFREHVAEWMADRERVGTPVLASQTEHLDTLCHSLFDEPLR